MVACVKSRAMMRTVAGRFLAICLLAALCGAPALADVNAGAALVQSHGCIGCHGAKLSQMHDRAKTIAALLQPSAPMPNFGFTAAQAGDIADYLATLGPQAKGPLITISPAHPSDSATVTIYFSGTPPQSVTAVASMAMGGSTMNSPAVQLARSAGGHTFTGRLSFSMGGAWTLRIRYNGKEIDRPLDVGQ